MGRVSGKVAIITGGAAGLGAADAIALGLEGAQIVITDLNEQAGNETVARIPGAIFIHHDVTREEDWQRVIEETLAKFGRLDILVNNAGRVVFQTIEETSLETFRAVFATHSEATFLGCKYAIGAMKKTGGGSIINISSICAIRGYPLTVGYTAGKGAILALTKLVATYCKQQQYNIRCNVILPGTIQTDMTRASVDHLNQLAAAKGEAQLPPIEQLGMGQPSDIANFVVYLASDESRFVNGADFVIDNASTIEG